MRLLRPKSNSLEKCTEVWGSFSIREHDPRITEFRDVVYLPYDLGAAWGIFDRSGRAIHETVDMHGPDQSPYRQLLETDADLSATREEADDDVYVYGGCINLHYGHFLVNSLPRFWPLVRSKFTGGVKYLCHGPGNPDTWFAIEFFSKIFTQLGLSRENFVTFDRATPIRHLIVPETSFGEQCFIHPIYVDLCHAVGAGQLRSMPSCRKDTPVYLSKTKLIGGVVRVINEDDIVNRLEKAGVEIIFPETLPFDEQVRLFAERSIITATTGSAFHTSLFAHPSGSIIGINVAMKPVNSNYLLIDSVNNNDSHYYWPQDITVTNIANSTFSANMRLGDPLGVAEGLLRIIDERKRSKRWWFLARQRSNTSQLRPGLP
jgi:capsular polysaccharide biosynthesis protein